VTIKLLTSNNHSPSSICIESEIICSECLPLWDISEKYFTVSSVKELFQNVIIFIKETHFYNRLFSLILAV